MVEGRHSHVKNLLKKTKSLLNITERSDLRLLLTNFSRNRKSILEKHHPQPSHSIQNQL